MTWQAVFQKYQSRKLLTEKYVTNKVPAGGAQIARKFLHSSRKIGGENLRGNLPTAGLKLSGDERFAA
jgi:hypothetical protein